MNLYQNYKWKKRNSEFVVHEVVSERAFSNSNDLVTKKRSNGLCFWKIELLLNFSYFRENIALSASHIFRNMGSFFTFAIFAKFREKWGKIFRISRKFENAKV